MANKPDRKGRAAAQTTINREITAGRRAHFRKELKASPSLVRGEYARCHRQIVRLMRKIDAEAKAGYAPRRDSDTLYPASRRATPLSNMQVQGLLDILNHPHFGADGWRVFLNKSLGNPDDYDHDMRIDFRYYPSAIG